MSIFPPFIRKERIHLIKDACLNIDGKYVLYFMEASQRSKGNFALETAIYIANGLSKPLLVYFGITDRYRYSNARYYTFMLEGLIKLRDSFKDRGIKLIIRKADPPIGAVELSKDAALLVCDVGYLRHQRLWRQLLLERVNVPIISVEGDVICPLNAISGKPEPYARTIRPKLYNAFLCFLEDLPEQEVKLSSLSIEVESWDETSVEGYISKLNIDKSVSPVTDHFKGGEDEALKRLNIFVSERLPLYAKYRSDPGFKVTSELSPYLRFGQISPVQIIRRILKEAPLEDENVRSFINELMVWRELARNYVWYNPLYNQYEGLPLWARDTLERHVKDKRPQLYPLGDLERAKTDDPYWNSAQRELLLTGKIHNYVRMYWCKKLLEWTSHPKEAFDIACYLNDKYALDGRDPNGYAGISWCFGAFDRPFPERPIFGRVRKMGLRSLISKEGISTYLKVFNVRG
ncbi:MAG: deoxyribodipyrimidine photo-lyase [Synergistetes bacterium]|nr:deoxyribodipyrimidine photo-lyase [Synergistota bacterium]MDW8191685.1 deoxyribodipyrimidine photo-lyase [Synergistota bacterium]